MEYSFDNIHKFTISVKTAPSNDMPEGYGFIHEGGTRYLDAIPQSDFFIPVFMTRTSNLITDYVDVTLDDTVFTMERQEVNPWFMEFGFFDTIKRNKVNEGANLSVAMINFIKSVRPEVSDLTNLEIKALFDSILRYEFPWNRGLSNQTTLDDLDKISFLNQNIVSKAFFLNIDINK